jgi:hypothetical protein
MQTFRRGLVLSISGRYREDAFNIVAVVGASEIDPVRLSV